MLKANSAPPDATFTENWRDQISHGDLVVFRFPIAGRADCAVPRPCLVLDIETVGSRRCAVLVPATPSRHPSTSARIVSIGRRADYRAAGLDRPTQFPVNQRLLVPLSHEDFVPLAETGSPLIGTLNSSGRARLDLARGRLHALRDMRDDRSSDHRSHRRQPVRGRDFVVEMRHPRRVIARPLAATANTL